MMTVYKDNSMYFRSENCWKRSGTFYVLPSLVYYKDSGFVEERSLTLSFLFWSVEIGTTLDAK